MIFHTWIAALTKSRRAWLTQTAIDGKWMYISCLIIIDRSNTQRQISSKSRMILLLIRHQYWFPMNNFKELINCCYRNQDENGYIRVTDVVKKLMIWTLLSFIYYQSTLKIKVISSYLGFKSCNFYSRESWN